MHGKHPRLPQQRFEVEHRVARRTDDRHPTEQVIEAPPPLPTTNTGCPRRGIGARETVTDVVERQLEIGGVLVGRWRISIAPCSTPRRRHRRSPSPCRRPPGPPPARRPARRGTRSRPRPPARRPRGRRSLGRRGRFERPSAEHHRGGHPIPPLALPRSGRRVGSPGILSRCPLSPVVRAPRQVVCRDYTAGADPHDPDAATWGAVGCLRS